MVSRQSLSSGSPWWTQPGVARSIGGRAGSRRRAHLAFAVRVLVAWDSTVSADPVECSACWAPVDAGSDGLYKGLGRSIFMSSAAFKGGVYCGDGCLGVGKNAQRQVGSDESYCVRAPSSAR